MKISKNIFTAVAMICLILTACRDNEPIDFTCETAYPTHSQEINITYDSDGNNFDYYPSTSNIGTLIYFHGGGEDADQTLINNQLPQSLQCWRNLGYNIVYASYSYTLDDIPNNQFELIDQFPLIHDAKEVIEYVYQNYDNRIYVYGYSFGAYMAQMVLSTNQSAIFGDTYPVIAGASFAGIHDWQKSAGYYEPGVIGLDYNSTNTVTVINPFGNQVNIDASFAWNWLGQFPNNNVIEALLASPSTYFYTGNTPMVFAHGKLDNIVPYQQSVDAHGKLQEYEVNTELIGGNGYDHFNITDCEVIQQAHIFFQEQSPYCDQSLNLLRR